MKESLQNKVLDGISKSLIIKYVTKMNEKDIALGNSLRYIQLLPDE
jgi:hypothetical protein